MDDVSAIPSDGCSVLTASGAISNYNGRVRKDYVQNGGTWYFYRTQYSNYNDYDITNFNCIDVSTINSFSYMTPIYYIIGFGLFAISIILFFKTIKGLMYHV